MSGSPSPPRPRIQDINGSANVVSINFIMNPIPVVLNDKRPKLKTEKNEEAESRSMAKTQHA